MAFLDILRSRKREEARPKRPPKGALKRVERPVKKQEEIKIASQEDRKKAEKGNKRGRKKRRAKSQNKTVPFGGRLFARSPYHGTDGFIGQNETFILSKSALRPIKCWLKKQSRKCSGSVPLKCASSKRPRKKESCGEKPE